MVEAASSLREGLRELGPTLDSLWKEVRDARDAREHAAASLQRLRADVEAEVLKQVEQLGVRLATQVDAQVEARLAQHGEVTREMTKLREELKSQLTKAEARALVDERVQVAALEAARPAAEAACGPLLAELRAALGEAPAAVAVAVGAPAGQLAALRAGAARAEEQLAAAQGELQAQRAVTARLAEDVVDTKRLSEAAQAAAQWAADAAVNATRGSRAEPGRFSEEPPLLGQLRRRVDQCQADFSRVNKICEDLELAHRQLFLARPELAALDGRLRAVEEALRGRRPSASPGRSGRADSPHGFGSYRMAPLSRARSADRSGRAGAGMSCSGDAGEGWSLRPWPREPVPQWDSEARRRRAPGGG